MNTYGLGVDLNGFRDIKVRKTGKKIRNQYNQALHLTQYGRLMLKAFYVRPSECIIFGHWKYNMLNFMSLV